MELIEDEYFMDRASLQPIIYEPTRVASSILSAFIVQPFQPYTTCTVFFFSLHMRSSCVDRTQT